MLPDCLQVTCHYGCPLPSDYTGPHLNSSHFLRRTNSSGSYQNETFESSSLELVASWKGVLPSVFQVLTNSSGQVMGVRLSIFFCNSGNGRRDFFYDDDDDNEFRVVSMFFRSISCSFIGLTRALPHRTLPKRRIRPGQVGSPDARTTKLSHDGRGECDHGQSPFSIQQAF